MDGHSSLLLVLDCIGGVGVAKLEAPGSRLLLREAS